MHKNDRTLKQMQTVLREAAILLCREGAQRTWRDTRTAAMSIRGLADCGVLAAAPEFREHCLDVMLRENDERVDEAPGLCFNREVWDTSLALVAVAAASDGDAEVEIAGMRRWILAQVSGDNVNHEPWETLWALNSLVRTDRHRAKRRNLYEKCLTWVLNCRTPAGVLIGPHYMGLLLEVLGTCVEQADLPASVRPETRIVVLRT